MDSQDLILELVVRRVLEKRLHRKVVSRGGRAAAAVGNRRNAGKDLKTWDEMFDRLTLTSKRFSRGLGRTLCSVRKGRFKAEQVYKEAGGAKRSDSNDTDSQENVAPRLALETERTALSKLTCRCSSSFCANVLVILSSVAAWFAV